MGKTKRCVNFNIVLTKEIIDTALQRIREIYKIKPLQSN